MEQNENREHHYLPKTTVELHQNTESPSKRREVEQNDVATGQSTAQEVSAKATPGVGS